MTEREIEISAYHLAAGTLRAGVESGMYERMGSDHMSHEDATAIAKEIGVLTDELDLKASLLIGN